MTSDKSEENEFFGKLLKENGKKDVGEASDLEVTDRDLNETR